MPAPGIRDIVRNLLGRGLSGPDVVSAYWSEVRAIGEDNAGKALVRRMVQYIHALIATYLKVQSLKSCSTFNPEVGGKYCVRKAIAKLVQQSAADHVVVRDQEAPIMYSESTSFGSSGFTTLTVMEFFRLNRAYTCCFEVIVS